MPVLYIRDRDGNFVPVPALIGPQGEPGAQGIQGIPGKDGEDGKSAYRYAQDGGYTGTEAEFAEKLAQEIPAPYILPPATPERLGGMIPGGGLNIDADGRVSVEPEGEYELLRSITVTDDTVIEYMVTGTCLDAVRTTMLTPASGFKNHSNGYQTTYFVKGGSVTVGGTCIMTNTDYGTRLDTYKAKRLWEAEALFGGTSTGTSTIAGPGRVDIMTPATDDDYISTVRVYTWNTDGCGYPKGTVINVYGVRHNA